MVNLGFKLGRHENSQHIFSADFICDVAIQFGRVDFVGSRLHEKNSAPRRKIFAVDNHNGNFATDVKQRRRAGRNANNKRGHGVRLELHCATLDGDNCALRLERKIDAQKSFRHFFGDSRLVYFNGRAGRGRFKRGVHNNFRLGVRGGGVCNC